MRTLLILLAQAAAILSGNAQSHTAQGSVMELTYEYINIGLGEKRGVKLLFRGQESLSIFSTRDSIAGSEQKDFDISGEDSRGRQVYRNTKTEELIFRDFVPDQNTFLPCIVNDPAKRMVWTHSSEVKIIGKFQCKAASTDFRGRKYMAWYTADIPVSHGPWKFSGLPGAIVELNSIDRNIMFTLIRIEQVVDRFIRPPTGDKEITMADYVRRKEQGLADFLSSLAARLPRGAQISVTTTGDYNLETDFSDVKK